MVSDVVPESREGVIGYLFYAAGALAGLSAGVLDVLARFLLAGLHLVILNAGLVDDHKARPIAKQRLCFNHGQQQHAKHEQDDHSAGDHVPGDAAALPAAASPEPPAAPAPEASWASADAAAEAATPDSSEAFSGESGAAAPDGTPSVQRSDVSHDYSGGAAGVVFVSDSSAASELLTQMDTTDAATGTPEMSACDPSEGVVAADAAQQVKTAIPIGTHAAPASPTASDLPEIVVYPRGTSGASTPPVEPETAPDGAPQQSQVTPLSLSPCCAVAAARDGDEAHSESGESGITAISYGTTNSVDPATGAPMSRRLKAATASASASAAATPVLSYTQRLEEKRQSTRRKGAHKAKAR